MTQPAPESLSGVLQRQVETWNTHYGIGTSKELTACLGALATGRPGEIIPASAVIADQLAGAVDWLDGRILNDSEASQEPDAKNRNNTRFLALIDQFMNYPDALGSFLADSRMVDSTFARDTEVMGIASLRLWNCGGTPNATMQIFDFARNHAKDREAIEDRLLGGLSGNLYHCQQGIVGDIERYQELLDGLVMADIKDQPRLQTVLDGSTALINSARERTQAETNRRAEVEADRAAKQATLEAERTNRDELAQSITKDPHTFSDFIESYAQVLAENPAALSEADLRLIVKGATTCLNVCSELPDSESLRAKAVDTVGAVLRTLPSGKLLSYQPYYYDGLKSSLVSLWPDRAALSQAVLEFPSIIEDSELYIQWKNSIIDQELTKRAKELVRPELVEQLKAQDVERLVVRANRLGIQYRSLEDLEQDLRQYFVYGIGDMTGLKLAHLAEVLDAPSDSAVGIISRFSRDDETILQKDIMEPLRRHGDHPENELPIDGETGLLIFMSREAEHGGTPYKYETTSFAGHAVVVRISKTNDGIKYFLDMQGGGYDSERFPGERLERFAAFCGRGVEYKDQNNVTVEAETGTHNNLRYYIRKSEDERQKELDAAERKAIGASKEEPELTPWHDDKGTLRSMRKIWPLTYDFRPNHQTLLALYELLGEETPITSTGGNFGEKPAIASHTDLPEPKREFVIRDAYDDSDEIEKTERYISVSPARKFAFPANPNGIRQLQSLAYLLHTASQKVII